MNINELTIGKSKELISMFPHSLNQMIGKKVIIRTYSAGVWFGTLSEKSRNEVIITEARRMWQWHAKESISLSAIAVTGIDAEKSKIAPEVNSIWLEAIEIIPCTKESIKSIEGAQDARAE